jgi:alpha-L-arabinofuranosidase
MELFDFLQDVLDSIEFARGSANSTWGSVRAAMGHPEPFPVKYVAIGNEDCGKKFYRGKFPLAVSNQPLFTSKETYPVIVDIENTSATICCNLLLVSWRDILYFC